MNKNYANDNLIDLDADHYTKHSSLQNNLAKEILQSCQIDPGAHILDVGCGDGRITAELAKQANEGTVLGVDASPNMIEFAIHNFSKTQFPNLDFLNQTAEEVELTRKYDLIVSFSCFHWLKNPQLAIRRLTSALKQGGELLILTYPKESLYYQYLESALKNYPDYHGLSANHTMLSSNEYKDILIENNMDILDFQERNLFATYHTPEELQDYIKGWLNSYVPLPDSLHAAFLQDIAQIILGETSICQDQKINIPYTALTIKAKKT
jgi:trans-aconitate methyltransferase